MFRSGHQQLPSDPDWGSDAWYGRNIPQYLTTNNTTQYYFARNPRINDNAMTDMLTMPASQVGNPIAYIVQVIAND